MPCDGEVLDGLAAVDESMLTGESVLVPKGVGAAVSGGCIVFEGPLTIKASATGAESTLAGGCQVCCCMQEERLCGYWVCFVCMFF